jgi:hypothetical protein
MAAEEEGGLLWLEGGEPPPTFAELAASRPNLRELGLFELSSQDIERFFSVLPPREFLESMTLLKLKCLRPTSGAKSSLAQAMRQMTHIKDLDLSYSPRVVKAMLVEDLFPTPPLLESLIINGVAGLTSLRKLAPAAATLNFVSLSLDPDVEYYKDCDRTAALSELATLPLQRELTLDLECGVLVGADVVLPATTVALCMDELRDEPRMPLHIQTPRLRSLSLCDCTVRAHWLSVCLPASLEILDLSGCSLAARRNKRPRRSAADGGMPEAAAAASAGGKMVAALDFRKLTALKQLRLRNFSTEDDEEVELKVLLPRPATALQHLDLVSAASGGVNVDDMLQQLQEQGVRVPELVLHA